MIYVSCSSYVLGRMFGHKVAEQFLTRAVQDPSVMREIQIPAAHAIRHIASLDEVTLRVDGGATCIGKSRSRHLAAALESRADVWVTIDDDVQTDLQTATWLVETVQDPTMPTVCIAPCLMREQNVMNVEWSGVYMTRKLSNGGMVRRARRAGFGLVAMNRAAMVEVAGAVPSFHDDDGKQKPAAFLEFLDGDRWLGEDLAFFRRLPMTVCVEGLITGETTHAGVRLNLKAASS